jgi:glycosyltransferase involved in cell wall biosynthesis
MPLSIVASMWFVAPENDYRALHAIPFPEPRLRVAVCMPVYNRVDLLGRTVAALVPQTYPSELMRVVVGDDGSDEDVHRALAPVSGVLDVSVVRREHDGYGAGHARNLAAAAATDVDVLVFVDSDCLPDRDYVLRHAMWHHRADNLVVIGSRHGLDTTGFGLDALMTGTAPLRDAAFGTEFPDDAAVRQTDHRRPLHRQTADQRHGDEAFRSLVSSNFSIRRDRFFEVGAFDESFRRWGFEDVELGWRCHVAGLFTVPEDRAINYHQLQEDLWDPEGRRESMERNRGVVQNKIPHAFYRKHQRGHIWEVPKVSVVVYPTVPGRLTELGDQIRAQSFTDWEVVAEGGTPEAMMFEEVNEADPRFRVLDVRDPADLIRSARGEYVALVHGDAAVEPRALSELVRRMDGGRRLSSAMSAYAVGDTVVRDPDTIDELDRNWDQRNTGTPVFLFTRRRDWSKVLRSAPDLNAAVARLRDMGKWHRHHQPLVALRSEHPDQDVGTPFPAFTNVNTRLRRDVAAAGVSLGSVKAVGKYLLRRDPVPDRSRTPRPPRRERAPIIRYVGWTGHENLGDEALLEAVTGVMPWGDVRTAKRGDLLLLGGGTLINRGSYITWLEDHDAPRIERAVFGSGVANPGFWGEPADRDRWVEWLSTCAYIGVRGPISAEVLGDWNVPGDVEVVGDAALLFEPTPARAEGRVVIAPCRTRGELWGGDDVAVFRRLAETTRLLVDRGHDVHLLACHPDDDGPCLEIMRRAGHPDLEYSAGYADLSGAIDLLASADIVVAERLHAGVLAAAAGTPFVGLEYRPKVRDFAASVDMVDWVLKTDALDGLEERVSAAISQREELSDRMAPHVEEYRRRLRRASATLQTFMNS